MVLPTPRKKKEKQDEKNCRKEGKNLRNNSHKKNHKNLM